MADKGLCISNERICAIVEMNDPGVWTLGEVRKSVQARGMGIVVEYAGAAEAFAVVPQVGDQLRRRHRPTSATDHLLVKGIVAHRFDWTRHSAVE